MMSFPENYFILFNLPLTFVQDKQQIKAVFLTLQKKMHPDNFVKGSAQEQKVAQAYTALINEAYRILIDPLQRAIYLLQLRNIDIQSETNTKMSTDFLMEQMTLREKLSEGKVEDVKKTVTTAINRLEKEVSTLLDSPDEKDWEKAQNWVRQWQFYQKLDKEIAVSSL